MGLSSWLQNLLAGKTDRSARAPREDFVQLYLNRLEDRRVLSADFALVGNALVLDGFSMNEALTVRDANATEYQFVLTGPAPTGWSTTDMTPFGMVSGTNNEILTVQKSDLDALTGGLQIVDPADDDLTITFEDANFSALTGPFDIDGAGSVIQSGGSTVQISTFEVDAVSLTLDQMGNDFGSVTINVSADATLRDANDLTLGAVSTGDAFQVTAGITTLTGNINTDSDPDAGNVLLMSDVILAADVTIDTDALTTDGSVSVTGTVNADSAANNRALAIISDSGNVDLQGDIGRTEALGDLSINTAGGTGAIALDDIGIAGGTPIAGASSANIGNNATATITFQGSEYVTVNGQEYRAASGNNFLIGTSIEFVSQDAAADVAFRNSTVALSGGAQLSIDAGNRIFLFSGIQGVSTETVVLTGGRANLGTISGIQSLLVDTSSAQTNGNITTSASNPTAGDNFVQFNAAFVLGNSITIDTSLGSGNIILNQRVEGNGQDLVLDAGNSTNASESTISATQIGVNNNQVNDLTITAGTFNLSQSILTRDEGGSGDVVIAVAGAFNLTGNVTIDTTDPTGDGSGTADGTLTVNGAINGAGQSLTINIGTNGLTLTDPANDFGTLGITANSASIADANSLILNDIVVATSFSLDVASGQSTQSAATTISGGMSLTTIGAGTLVLSEANAYTGGTILNAGTLLVNNVSGSGTGTGNVDVNNGATLGGTGSIDGAVAVNAGGTVSPGTSPGQLTFNGGLDLSGGNFDAEIDGNAGPGMTNGHDQLVVNGSVDVSGASLNLLGIYAPIGGDSFVIIDNDGADSVVGEFAGFPDDASFSINGVSVIIDYQGGDGNDVEIFFDPNQTIDGTAGDDNFYLRKNGDVVELYSGINAAGTLILQSDINLIDSLTINGLLGDDLLIIDYGNADNEFFDLPITFNGGGQTSSDALRILGPTEVADTVTHQFDAPGLDGDNGSATIDDGSFGTTTINYTGLEPVLDTITATDRIFTFTGGAETIALSNDLSQAGRSRIDSTLGESVQFINPLGSLTINTELMGGSGVDAVNLQGIDPSFNANLIVNAGSDDTVTFQTNPTGIGSGDFDITAGSIAVNAAASTTGNAILTATSGGITGSGVLTADNANLTAVTGINLNTTLVSVTADVTGVGAIMLVETDDIALVSITTNAGDVTVNAGGSIALGQVQAAGNTVTVTAGNQITDADFVVETANIIADTIRLQAANGIGASGAPMFGDAEEIDISAVTLFARNTASGSIQISDDNGIALDQIINPGRTVLIDAGTGAITDANPADDTNPNIMAGFAGLMAATGIGSDATLDEDIDLVVGTIAAVTNTGDINLQEADDLIIGAVGGIAGLQITAGGMDDDITAVANGNLTVDDAVTNGGTGNVVIDANGVTADVELGNAIMTAGGNVTVTADDTVTFLATGSIVALGAGNVVVRADEDDQTGDSGDQILMNDDGANNAFINADSGTIRLRTDGVNGNGGDITITQLVTANTSPDAVQIESNARVVDGGDSDSAGIGGADIQAIAAASTINITSVTGVGTLGDALETSGVRFNVENTSAGPINITNTVDNLDVVIEGLTTTGQAITFINDDPDDLTPGLLTIASTGVVNASDGGMDNDIKITTEGALTVAVPLSTQGGTGGAYSQIGGVTFTPAMPILLGTGDITLQSGAQDIFINSDFTIDGPASFYAPRDIIVSARLLTRVDDGTNTFVNATTSAATEITADITLSADNDGMGNGDGVGGVLIQGIGEVIASGNLLIEGSDLFNDGLTNALPAGIRNGVHIERDNNMTEQVQVVAAGSTAMTGIDSLIVQNRSAAISSPGNDNAESDIVLEGMLGTRIGMLTTTANMNVLINANENIHLANDTAIFAGRTPDPMVVVPANVAFGDMTGRAPVIDDGVLSTPSNLLVNADGTTTFFGRVDGIDSLTTNAAGETHIRGGLVNTVDFQTYNDAVFINADTPLFDTTTISAGGDVNFNSTVDGQGPTALDDLILNVSMPHTTTFHGAVGSIERIGDGVGHAITINSTGETRFNSQVFTQSGILQADAAGRVTFKTGDVTIDAGDSDSEFRANVTLDSMTMFSNGNLTFGNGLPNSDQLFIAVGSVLDTRLMSRNITINSRVLDPAVGPNQDLRLNLNAGNLLVNGSVGMGTNRFGDFVIVSANNFLFGPTRTQLLFAESLVQLTGSGLTRLNSPVDVLDTPDPDPAQEPQGVTIATFDVMYDAAVDTNGQRALTQAARNIIYTGLSSLVTEGGRVVSDASGAITMEEMPLFTATIDAAGGNVVLQAVGNLTLSQIRSLGGYVALTSQSGAIIDAGDIAKLAGAIGTNDVQAVHLRLVAGQGIGTTGNAALETIVSNLEAANGSNGISISNTGSLTIGGLGSTSAETFRDGVSTLIPLPTLNGVSTDSGNIDIVTTGAMSVNEDVINQDAVGIGDINLAAITTTGQFTVNPSTTPMTVIVTNIQTANGSVNINAGANFVANNMTQIASNTGDVFVQVGTLTGGDATFSGEVMAQTSGNILVDVSGQFTLNGNGSFSEFEMSVEGTGQIVVAADGTVNFSQMSGARVASRVDSLQLGLQPGIITAVDRRDVPMVRDVVASPINADFLAELTFTVGNFGETNFTVIVDWGDGSMLDVIGGLAGGVPRTIMHQFSGPPNPANPGAPIQVILVAVTDPNIHFFGNNNNTLFVPGLRPLQVGPALPQPGQAVIGQFLDPEVPGLLFANNVNQGGDFIDFALNPLDSINGGVPFGASITSLDVVTVFPVFPVPLNPIQDAAVFELDEVPPIFVPPPAIEAPPTQDEEFNEEAGDLDFSGSDAEEKGEDEIIVRLRVLSPTGRILYEYEIETRYLANPEPLWLQLRDGRYQIVIQEPGRSIPIVVRDVELKDHKVIRRFDQNRRDRNSETSLIIRPGTRVSRAEPDASDLSTRNIYRPAELLGEPIPASDEVWEHWRTAPGPARMTISPEADREQDSNSTEAVAASAGLVFGLLSRRTSDAADDQMTRFSRRALSPAARLRRRLRK